MFQFRADPRNGLAAAFNPCEAACCCEQATAVPGETNGWAINYLPWAAPLGGRGLTGPTQITVTQLAPALSDPPPNPLPTPAISVPTSRVSVRGFVLSFPVVAAPGAVVGTVYRLAIQQPAMDCDGNLYTHVSCYDVAIVKC